MQMRNPDSMEEQDPQVPAGMPSDPGESYTGVPREATPCPAPAVSHSSQDGIATPALPIVPVGPPPGSDQSSRTPRIHHRYTLSHLIGTGGQGEVWQATQRTLHRPVAVKLLRGPASGPADGGADDEWRQIEYFHQEALLAGSLEHPNIIPVHDLVYDGTGRPVLVMKEVRGRRWYEVLKEELGNKDDAFYDRNIPVLMNVAQAVAFAHSRGVIHRDLKPSQVLIGEFGEVLLTDWGLAVVLKSVGGDAAEALLARRIRGYPVSPAGTPAYMAPEQTEYTLENVGPWTDVFLLGGILYFLLTGTAPHAADNARSAYLLARTCNIEPPEQRAPGTRIPAELSRLAMKALERDPKRRMDSAVEFHDALRSYLSGAGKRGESLSITDEVARRCGSAVVGYSELAESQADLARAEGLWPENPQLAPLQQELTTRFAELALANNDLVLAQIQGEILREHDQRDQVLQKVDKRRRQQVRASRERRFAIRAVGVLILLFLMATSQYIRVEVRARDQAEDARTKLQRAHNVAVAERNVARQEQYFAGIGFAEAFLREGRPARAWEMLLKRVPSDLRGLEWGHLLSRIQLDDMLLLRPMPGEDIYRAEFSPDGGRIVTGQRGGRISIWDTLTGRNLISKVLPMKGAWATRFSPDGQRILLASIDGEARILNASTGETELLLQDLQKDGVVLRGACFSPDGALAVTTSSDKNVRIWNAASGQLVQTLVCPHVPYDVSFAPDGRRIAVAMLGQGQVVLADVATGQTLHSFAGHDGSVYSVAVSPDGKQVLTACRDRKLRLFGLESGQLLRTFATANTHPNLAVFSQDGSRVAAACEDGSSVIWETASGQAVGTIQTAPEMYAVAFHPDGRRLLTSCFSEVRLWDLDRALMSPAKEAPHPATAAKAERIRQVSFPFDREIVWAGRDQSWMTSAPAIAFTTRRTTYAVEPYSAVSSPDGKQRLVLGDGSVVAYLLRGKADQPHPLPSGEKLFNACFSTSGTRAATAAYQGDVRVWTTGEPWQEEIAIPAEPGAGVPWSLDFSPDETLLAIGYQDGQLAIWDLANRKIRARVQAHLKSKPVVMVRFNPEGSRVLTSSSDRTARVWNTTGRIREVATLSGHAKGLLSGVFSPDGRRILTASFDNTAKLWDTDTGRELVTMFRTPARIDLMSAGFGGDGLRTFFTTSDRKLYELEAMPYLDSQYEGDPSVPLEVRVELWKRRNRLNPACRLEDISWVKYADRLADPLHAGK